MPSAVYILLILLMIGVPAYMPEQATIEAYKRNFLHLFELVVYVVGLVTLLRPVVDTLYEHSTRMVENSRLDGRDELPSEQLPVETDAIVPEKVKNDLMRS